MMYLLGFRSADDF